MFRMTQHFPEFESRIGLPGQTWPISDMTHFSHSPFGRCSMLLQGGHVQITIKFPVFITNFPAILVHKQQVFFFL